MRDLQACVESARKGRTRGFERGLCHRVVLLLEDELDDSAGIHRLVIMHNGSFRSSRREIVWATYHEGRVVLDESIGTTRHYFDLGGLVPVTGLCGQSGQKAEQGGEREEFREHH